MWALTSTLLIFSTAAFAASDFYDLIGKGLAAYHAYDLNSAEQAYSQACELAAAKPSPSPQTAFCEHGLGAVAELRGNGDEAVRHYLKALIGWENSGNKYLALRIATLTSLGDSWRRQRHPAEAENTLGQAFELVEPIAGLHPELYAAVLSRLGNLYAGLDQPERARATLKEAITAFRILEKPYKPELAAAYNSLGMLDLTAGHYKTAEASLREAVELANASLGENNPEAAGYAANLAQALLAEHEYLRAETLLRRARFVIESGDGADSFQLVPVLAGMTSVEAALGEFRMAEDCGEKALAILNSHASAGDADRVLIQVNLGTLYLRERKTAEAEKILPTAVEAERRLFKDGWSLGAGIRGLAALRAQQHAWNEAGSFYREALGLYERTLGPDHPDIASLLREYANVMKHQGASKAEIRSIEARARALENPPART